VPPQRQELDLHDVEQAHGRCGRRSLRNGMSIAVVLICAGAL
jgi:hypothetical protein